MIRALALALAAAAVLALPAFGDPYAIRLGTILAMYVVLAVSWNFIGGMVGYPSFASASFFGLGAYTGAILQARGLWMPLAWGCGCLMAGAFAALLGAAILRLRGHYFAIASLVTAEVLREIVTSWTSLTGGGMGFNLPIIRISLLAQARLFYAAMTGLALLAIATSLLVARHRLGFGLRCIKQNEDAAGMVGIDATLYKVIAFTLSAVFVGGSGAIYASWVFYIEPPDVFEIMLSVKPVVMVLLGGAGTTLGPVLGAAIFLLLEELVWRHFLTVHAAMLGVLIVLLIFFLPRGVLGSWPGLVPLALGRR